jgi:hypothetical protein
MGLLLQTYSDIHIKCSMFHALCVCSIISNFEVSHQIFIHAPGIEFHGNRFNWKRADTCRQAGKLGGGGGGRHFAASRSSPRRANAPKIMSVINRPGQQCNLNFFLYSAGLRST